MGKMRPFKFFQKEEKEVCQVIRSTEHIPVGFVNVRLRNRQDIINLGWRDHRDNLPPGQCPYDIGTQERDCWMVGWSDRERYESIREIGEEFHRQAEHTITFNR